MKIAREGKLQQVLDEMGVKNPRSHEIPFSLLVEHIDTAMQQQTHVDVEHRVAIGLARAIAATKGTAKKKRRNWIKILAWFGTIVTLLAIVATNAHAQAPSANITRIGGTLISGTNPVDTGNQAFRVNCVTGCSAGASFPDSSAFTFTTTSVGNISAVVDDVATNTVAENSAGAVRMNTNRILYVDLSKSAANVNKFLTTPDNPPNLDVALSTRLKPADTLAAVTTLGTITNVVHVDDNAGSLTIDNANLDVALSTRLKPADTLAAVTTVGTITNVVHVDDNAGSLTVDGTVTTSPPANASTNVTQFGGTNVSTGTGVSGVGIPRVTISNDSSLAANQSVNVAQIGGSTTSTSATGVQKVGIVGSAGATLDSAPGAALPTNVQVMGGRDSTQTGGGTSIPVLCDKSAVVTATAAATVVVIALAASKVTYVCGFSISGGGAAGTMTFKYGTGTTCGTGTTALSGAYTTAIGQQISYASGMGFIFKTASANDFCITMATASATAAGIITYAQF